MRSVVSAIVAYAGSRALFAAFGFDYDVFSEPFDLVKLIIDLSVFLALFYGCYGLLGLREALQSKDAA